MMIMTIWWSEATRLLESNRWKCARCRSQKSEKSQNFLFFKIFLCINGSKMRWRTRVFCIRVLFSESEKSQLRPPLSRKRCTGRSSSRVREVLRIEFYLIGQSLELRERRRALFHSTPESPIDRGTIQQAIWSKTQIYLMVTKTFARFSRDFI